MNFIVSIGSNLFIGTSGLITYQDEKGVNKEFFRVREIYRARSENSSYLTIDCDIKDEEGRREVKLFKNHPVANDDEVKIERTNTSVRVTRNDVSLVIQVVQLEFETFIETATDFIKNNIPKELTIDAVLDITGTFFISGHTVKATESEIIIPGGTISGNISIGTGGMYIGPNGFGI